MTTKEERYAEEHARLVFRTLCLPGPDGALGAPLSETWEVSGVLGMGGEATVLHLTPHASDFVTPPPVALKVLNEKMNGRPLSRQRLRLEAERLKHCNGPHIVRCEGLACNVNDEPGLLLELVNPDGKTLTQRGIENANCVDLARKVMWFTMCVNALGSLHRHQIAHRDVKSHNFCVSPDGRAVKLIDLTMSTYEHSEDADLLCGTEHYWPPDRKEEGCSPLHADLFALCLVFSEILLGRIHELGVQRWPGVVPALDASLRGTLEKALWRMHADLGRLFLPKSLIAFVRRGTMPTQADRFQSIEQLKAALEWATLNL